MHVKTINEKGDHEFEIEQVEAYIHISREEREGGMV